MGQKHELPRRSIAVRFAPNKQTPTRRVRCDAMCQKRSCRISRESPSCTKAGIRKVPASASLFGNAADKILRSWLQCIADCITCLFDCGLGVRFVAKAVKQNEVVDRSVIAGGGHRNASLFELACIGFAFVAQRIVPR